MKINFWHGFYVVLAWCFLFSIVKACYIWGTDSGYCTSDTEKYTWRSTNIPFCAGAVNYPVCAPVQKKMQPSMQYPHGRWNNLSITDKDDWVRRSYNQHVQQQLGYERNKTMYRSGRDINGHKGHVARRFWKRPDCQNAFKNLFCYINFPRCDTSSDMTLPTCRSACENFFKSCKYSRDLWRCGRSKFFNGYEPEAPTLVGNNITYLREYFPGQPWRQNRYTKGGSEVAICTPAILGAASPTFGGHGRSLVIFIATTMFVSFLLLIGT